MSARYGSWIYVVCFLLAPGLARQNGLAGQSAPPGSGQIKGANRQMTLDVVVTEKSGKPMPGLKEQDFTLLDNKRPQKIVSFQAVEGGGATSNPPVEVVLLVDEVNAPFNRVASGRNEIEKFLRRSGGVLARPVSVAFFSDAGLTIGNTPSLDGNAVIADMNQNQSRLRVTGSSLGINAAVDHTQSSLRAMGQLADYEAARPGRKLVIWISPGWPYASDAAADLSAKDKRGFFDTHVALAENLRRAQIALYNVDPFGTADAVGTSDYTSFLKEPKTAGQVLLGHLALQVFAANSGGRVLNSFNDVAGEIAKCVADGGAFYVLSFDGPVGALPNEYHALEIKIGKPGLAARTISGYYAQPEN